MNMPGLMKTLYIHLQAGSLLLKTPPLKSYVKFCVGVAVTFAEWGVIPRGKMNRNLALALFSSWFCFPLLDFFS